jgi:hypothetical protein
MTGSPDPSRAGELGLTPGPVTYWSWLQGRRVSSLPANWAAAAVPKFHRPGRPRSQAPVVGVGERPAAADGDDAGVAVLREDHG